MPSANSTGSQGDQPSWFCRAFTVRTGWPIREIMCSDQSLPGRYHCFPSMPSCRQDGNDPTLKYVGWMNMVQHGWTCNMKIGSTTKVPPTKSEDYRVPHSFRAIASVFPMERFVPSMLVAPSAPVTGGTWQVHILEPKAVEPKATNTTRADGVKDMQRLGL